MTNTLAYFALNIKEEKSFIILIRFYSKILLEINSQSQPYRGATSLSIMTLSIMTLSIMDLIATLSIKYNHHNDTLQNN